MSRPLPESFLPEEGSVGYRGNSTGSDRPNLFRSSRYQVKRPPVTGNSVGVGVGVGVGTDTPSLQLSTSEVTRLRGTERRAEERHTLGSGPGGKPPFVSVGTQSVCISRFRNTHGR